MSAYFTMESASSSGRVTFWELKTRLITTVNARILNGEFTERGLARILGISQPQIHNVLKGARRLSVDVADRLLTILGLSLMDLLREEEFKQHDRSGQADPISAAADLAGRSGIRQRAPKRPAMRETGARRALEASSN
jgi:transcriptional regulator with XRE-family HTH domain